jgi:hypothetical protein
LACRVTAGIFQAIATRAGHEHAGDIRHSARNAVGCFCGLGIESQVLAKLRQNFNAIAFIHRLWNEIADPDLKQRVTNRMDAWGSKSVISNLS